MFNELLKKLRRDVKEGHVVIGEEQMPASKIGGMQDRANILRGQLQEPEKAEGEKEAMQKELEEIERKLDALPRGEYAKGSGGEDIPWHQQRLGFAKGDGSKLQKDEGNEYYGSEEEKE